jgi:hypothetical protein
MLPAIARASLCVALVACGSSTSAPPERGPAYTATVAYQLSALAPQCDIKPGAGEVREVRSCLGPSQTTMKIELGAERHFRGLEISVLVASAWEARHKMEQTLASIVSPAVIDAMNKRLQPEAVSAPPITIDGLQLAVAIVGQRYTVTLTW